MSKDYIDTSFVISLYRPDAHSVQATTYLALRRQPLEVSSLMAFEFEQGIQLRLFRKAITFAQSHKALGDWSDDLAAGHVTIVATDWIEVFQTARRVAKRTPLGGHRSMDILHVATALVKGAAVFVSFDNKQRTLAELEGLKVKP